MGRDLTDHSANLRWLDGNGLTGPGKKHRVRLAFSATVPALIGDEKDSAREETSGTHFGWFYARRRIDCLSGVDCKTRLLAGAMLPAPRQDQNDTG